MLIPQEPMPCPSCQKTIFRGFVGYEHLDNFVILPLGENERVWTDGLTDSESVDPGRALPTHGEFIAKCPKCSALFPDHLVPWRDRDPNRETPRELVLGNLDGKIDESNDDMLLLASLEETAGYLEFLNNEKMLHYWEAWTATQQLIYLGVQQIRTHGKLDAGIELRAQRLVKIMAQSLSGATEGAFASRTLLDDASRLGEMPEWVVFADMFRIAGDFRLASQYLDYAFVELEHEKEESEISEFFEFAAVTEDRFKVKAARINLIADLIDEGDSTWTSSALVLPEFNAENFLVENTEERDSENRQKVYTFYINDPDAEIGVFGKVAQSADAVEEELIALGYRDFFLFEERDLLPEELPESADFRIKLSPHLGPQWMPVVDALELVIRDPRSKFFCIQTLAKVFNFNPSDSPFIQGMVLPEGRFHLEAPKNFFENEVLDRKKLEQMLFIGWNEPGDTDATYNFWRVFDFGWNPRAIAEFTLETLTTVFGITDQDFFDFGSTWQPEEIWRLRNLHRVKKHEGNPKGSIFHIPDDKFKISDYTEHESGAESATGTDSDTATEEHAAPESESAPSNKDKYRKLLSDLNELYESLETDRVLEKIQEARSLDENGEYRKSIVATKELLTILEKLDYENLSENFTLVSDDLYANLKTLVESMPDPFGNKEALKFSELPKNLQHLIREMVERVENKFDDDGELHVATLRVFMTGTGAMNENAIQKEMAKLLRLLVD